MRDWLTSLTDLIRDVYTVASAVVLMAWRGLVEIYSRHPLWVDAAVLVVVIALLAFAFEKDRRRKAKKKAKQRQERAKRMTRKERVQYLRDLFGYEVSNLIDNLVDNKKISEGEGRAYRRRFAQVVNLKGLIPQTAIQLSASEKRSLAETLKIITGQKSVSKIPGPKPGEKCEPIKGDNVVPMESKRKFGASFKRSK